MTWATGAVVSDDRRVLNGSQLLTKRHYIKSNDFASWVKRVQIENKDAIEIIENYAKRHERFKFVFYCDPPYPQTAQTYEHKYNMADFEKLLETLAAIKNHKFILSTFPNDCVEAFGRKYGWQKEEFEQLGGPKSDVKKVECLYYNYENKGLL